MDKILEMPPAGSRWHYKIRRSGRAKKIRLSYAASTGLELVLPHRTALAEGLSFLAAQDVWIAAIAKRYDVDLSQPFAAPAIPRTIQLNAIGEQVQVLRGGQAGLRIQGDTLHLKAPAEQAPLLLQRWMREKAKEVLFPWLASCSSQTGLRYSAASVRNQASRWGSYSSRGSVSLNCRLLLLEPALVNYVLLHELCHSKHMNHSGAFWRLLESVCPDARALDHAVDEAAKSMPAWITYRV